MAAELTLFESLAQLAKECKLLIRKAKENESSFYGVLHYYNISLRFTRIMHLLEYEIFDRAACGRFFYVKRFLAYAKNSLLPRQWKSARILHGTRSQCEFLYAVINQSSLIYHNIDLSDSENEFMIENVSDSMKEFFKYIRELCNETRGTDQQFDENSIEIQDDIHGLFRILESTEFDFEEMISQIQDGNDFWEYNLPLDMPMDMPIDLYALTHPSNEVSQVVMSHRDIMVMDKFSSLSLDELKLVDDADECNRISGIDHSECAICKDAIDEKIPGVYPYTLHANSACMKHKFHHRCISVWLSSNSHKCPICRN